MKEKTFKKVCECQNCGNEAEMTITCRLLPEEAPAASPKTATAPHHHGKLKGHAVCSRCGNEADIWLDEA